MADSQWRALDPSDLPFLAEAPTPDQVAPPSQFVRPAQSPAPEVDPATGPATFTPFEEQPSPPAVLTTDLDDLFGADDIASSSDPEPASDPFAADPFAAEPSAADPFTSVEDDQVWFQPARPTPTPVEESPPTSGIAEMRAAAERATEASGGSALTGAPAKVPKSAHDTYLVNSDRIIGLITNDPSLQAVTRTFELTRDTALDNRQRQKFKDVIQPHLHRAHVMFESAEASERTIDIAYDEIIGISVLGDLWRDDDVTEICVDAWDRIAVERNGTLEVTGYRFRSSDHARSVARNLSQKISDRGVSNSNAIVTAQLPEARVQFIYGRLSASGLAITIRKFRKLMGSEGLLAVDALTEEMRDFLKACVIARATILVSGGTGTGKTTIINALSEFIPDTERIVSIEDAFELQLANTHVVSLQAKTRASADDTVIVTQADLLIASLRMRPDRIIVGEIREPDAASVMFDAANTGHDGTMTTIHADSPGAALNARLAALLVRSNSGFSEQIARLATSQAVNLVIQVSRRRGRRFISEIGVVDPTLISESGLLYTHPVFKSGLSERPDGTVEVVHRRVGSVPADTELAGKLMDAGQDEGQWTQK